MSEISVQLFSVRDQLAADPSGTLSRLAELGFTAVEPFGFEDDPGAQAAALAAAGLRAPSVHASLFSGDPAALLDAAASAGVGTVVDPLSSEENWRDRDAVARFAEGFARLAPLAARAGVRIGYHNHDIELRSTIDGRLPLEVFAEVAPPDVVLQVDAYWAQAAGVDPVDLLRRLGDRVASVHLKDGDGRVDAHSQVALGDGDQPLAEILAAAPRAHRVLELDDPGGDVFDALARSASWLRENDR